MKKIFKSRIFAFILGAILFGGIGVVSAYTILANDIGYTPKDTTWKKSNGEDITNVKDAIDELYIKSKEGKTATQVATLTTQGATYTMQNDGYITGTIQPTYKQAGGIVYFNVNESDEHAVFVAPWDNNTIWNVSIFAQKNTTIYTRENYGTYNLTIYEWK